MFAGQGISGDYWFPILVVIASLLVRAGGWRGKTWAFMVIATWSVLALIAMIALAISNANAFRFRGDTLGIDVSIAWIGPLLFGVGSIFSVIAARCAFKHPATASVPWSTRNGLWLAGLTALLPIQFVLLRFGHPGSLNDPVGVIITTLQWFLIDFVFKPYSQQPATIDVEAKA